MFFRPDQAREIFFACRDNDERLAFVGKVTASGAARCQRIPFLSPDASAQAMFKIAVDHKDQAQQEVHCRALRILVVG